MSVCVRTAVMQLMYSSRVPEESWKIIWIRGVGELHVSMELQDLFTQSADEVVQGHLTRCLKQEEDLTVLHLPIRLERMIQKMSPIQWNQGCGGVVG